MDPFWPADEKKNPAEMSGFLCYASEIEVRVDL
jgi:hypothetical protein